MQTLNISINLILNNVSQGDDVFIHGFRLKDDQTIEEFSSILFEEGVKKAPKNSILSTIALLNHEKPLDIQIANYVLHGNYRVVLKIPEEINGLFLGTCKKKYGDAGNQDSKNSVLDFLDLTHIPSEFIVGIFYTDREINDDGEKVEYKFIQNPNYYDHIDFGTENSQKLEGKLESSLKGSEFRKLIVEHIMKGSDIMQSVLDSLKGYGLLDEYEYFIQQRQEYIRNKEIGDDELLTL